MSEYAEIIRKTFSMGDMERDKNNQIPEDVIRYTDIRYANHDEKIKCKRYDFMVQENLMEKGFKIIGFLFSHMAYWNNPDVFYFIIKMIHWQGYNELIYNYIRTNKN